MSIAEIKEKVNHLGHAWEQFKMTNNSRLDEKDRYGESDSLTLEALKRLNDTIEDCQQKLYHIELGSSRPGISSSHRQHIDSYSKQFERYVRKGMHPDLSAKAQPYMVHDDNYGGALVSQQVSSLMVLEGKFISPFRQLSTIEEIATSTLEIIIDMETFTISDSGWSLERVVPGGLTLTDATKVFALKVDTYELYAQPYTTQKFLDDSSINVERWLAEKLQYAFSQEEERAFLLGTGTDRPLGVLSRNFTEATDEAWGYINEIKTGVSGGITPDSIFALYYSLNEKYAANASFLMHRRMLETIRLLKVNDNHLWQPGFHTGARETVIGVPVYFSSFMPMPAPDSRSIILADFQKAFVIADRKDMYIIRDILSYKPLVAFYTTKRLGFEIMNYNAIKALKLSL